MAKMTYKITLAQGMTLKKITLSHKNTNLVNDKKSDTVYENTTGYQAFVVDRKVNIYVEAYGTDGQQWSLEVKVDGNKLTPEPIIQEVEADGNATGNATGKAIHIKDYPYPS